MEKRQRKVRKTVRKGTAVLVATQWTIGILAALLVIWGGWYWRGGSAYRNWRNQKRLETAERLLREGHHDEAASAARAVFNADNNNLRAVRIIATAADRLSPFAARPWRQRAFDLAPWDITNRIELALTAIAAGDSMTARTLLLAVGTNVPPIASYHEALGAAQVSISDLTGAEMSFSKASRLDPSNLDRQFNLARVRLLMDSPSKNLEARRSLDLLATNEPTRVAALTLRIEDALRGRRNSEALRLAEQMVASTNVPFASRLLHLTALKASGSPKLEATLEQLKKTSAGRPQEIAQIAVWMSNQGMSAAALAWARTLPRETVADPSVRIAVADLLIGVKDWLGLRQWVRSEDWKGFDSFRIAYDAVSAHFLASADTRTTEQDALWKRAIKAANGNPAQLQALAKMAVLWHFEPQLEATLWTIAESGALEEGALIDLNRLYIARQDTLGQLKVARRLHTIRPTDLSALNNVVYLGLLLDRNDAKLQELADTLHVKSPKNPAHVATYAFALFTRGQHAQAVEIMNSLGTEILNRPLYSAMQGIFLAHAGNAKGAREALTRATGATLSPEEDALVRTARAMVRMTP